MSTSLETTWFRLDLQVYVSHNNLLMCSDVLRSFIGFFKTLSMLHDADDMSASHPGSPGSTFVLPGKSSQPFIFDLSLTCPDVVCSFIGRFQSSPLCPGTPDATAWALVHSMSQLEAAFLSPSSLTLRDLVCRGAGLSGGVGGVRDVLGACSSSREVR